MYENMCTGELGRPVSRMMFLCKYGEFSSKARTVCKVQVSPASAEIARLIPSGVIKHGQSTVLMGFFPWDTHRSRRFSSKACSIMFDCWRHLEDKTKNSDLVWMGILSSTTRQLSFHSPPGGSTVEPSSRWSRIRSTLNQR